MKNNRVFFALAAAVTALSILLSSAVCAVSEGDTVTISSRADFIALTKSCTLDTYSRGKTVVLTKDIDFSGHSFSSIPIFCGVFDGNGHSISGIRLQEKGSCRGVFRYLEEGGKITGLTVKGKISPGGTKSFVGGIVGENRGTIENSSFSGAVEGENSVGGIAGENSDTGRIVSCTASGTVTGENYTGGIAGKNSGYITDCKNNAEVNTAYEEKKTTLSSVETDTGAILESYKNAEAESTSDAVFGHTDTGGIAGYSSGIIQGSENNARVGYKHVGYNVGGIAGRQSGFVLGCKNNGTISGRKDTGGIVGQTEPYISLSEAESILKRLRSELNKLNTMADTAVSDADKLGDDIKLCLDNISSSSEVAGENAKSMLDRATYFADTNLDEINEKSATLQNTLDKLDPVFKSLSDSAGNAAEAAKKISEALSDFSVYAPDLEDEIKEITDGLREIAAAERSIKKASRKAEKAADNLNDAVKIKDASKVSKAVSELASAFSDISAAKGKLSEALSAIKDILDEAPEDFEDIGISAKELSAELKLIIKGLKQWIKAAEDISDSLDVILGNTEIDFDKFKEAAKNAASALEYLVDATESISGGLKAVADGTDGFSSAFSDYADDMAYELSRLKNGVADGLFDLAFAADDIRDATDEAGDIVSDLAADDPLEFVKLGEEFREAGDGLYSSISDISDSIESLEDIIANGHDTLTADINALSGQFNVVMNLMIDGLEEIKNGAKGLSDVFLDVSDEEIESMRQGKIKDCTNYGEVISDRNSGGIVGCMATEYKKDPEDDFEKPEGLNFTYRTKAVVEKCINKGSVTGKKDCAGGIVGYSEVGTVYKCESYAEASSTGGGYVGGIAGKSSASIRKCSAKGEISGKSFIGGIAGKGNNVTDCYAICTVTGDESLGAVLGAAEELSGVRNNFYVGNDEGAVDGISYKGRAEEADFEALSAMADVPKELISFKVSFVVDGKEIESAKLKYGDDTKKITYPEIPEKKGEFGVWQSPKTKTVKGDMVIECEYRPYITVISSEERSEGGERALLLAQGEFTDKAQLHIKKSEVPPYENARGKTAVYDISLSDTHFSDKDEVSLRLLNENGDKLTVYVYSNGKWEKAKTSKRGSYVVFKGSGTKNTVCVSGAERSHVAAALGICAAAIAAAAAAFVILKKKKSGNA